MSHDLAVTRYRNAAKMRYDRNKENFGCELPGMFPTSSLVGGLVPAGVEALFLVTFLPAEWWKLET